MLGPVRRLLAFPLAALACVATLAACGAPRSLAVSNVVTGLSRPWDIAFVPDGTMLFTTKDNSRLNAFVGGSVRTFTGQPADATVSGEGGMMGLAVDPQFSANRRIYACFLSTLGSFGGLDVRLVRWTLDAGYTALSNRTDIVTGLPVNTSGQVGRHSGCRPRFGPDGHLYVGTGDAATGTNPQSKTSLGGKVLRVTTNGAGVPGNPGVDDPSSGFDPRIFTYGHRNVQGIAFRHDGTPYSVEHGTGCDDEVNRLVAGGNYGWDPVPGYNESRPMTDLVKFPNAVVAVWSSGCPTIAPSGATFVSGSQWAGWNTYTLLMAVLKDQHLHAVTLDGAGTRVAVEHTAIFGQGRLRSAAQGPDGNLYIATDANPGRIIKVIPTP
jgi:glucose/arabinose dehydrogenase